MSNYPSCHLVADYFLTKVDHLSGDSISNLKLQKLCYYAQAWHLAIHGKPLFGQRIEAWAHGPAIPDLYQRFKHYKWGAIDPFDLQTMPLDDLHESDQKFLDHVWKKYSRFTGRQLEQMTHADDPWKQAYGHTPKGGRCNAEITNEAMRSFYSRRLPAAAA